MKIIRDTQYLGWGFGVVIGSSWIYKLFIDISLGKRIIKLEWERERLDENNHNSRT